MWISVRDGFTLGTTTSTIVYTIDGNILWIVTSYVSHCQLELEVVLLGTGIQAV